MSRLARIGFAFAAAASFACSSNPPGADGGSGTTGASSATGSHGSTAGTGGSSGGSGTSGGTVGPLSVGQLQSQYESAYCQALGQCLPLAAYVQSGCAQNVAGGLVGAAFAQIAADVDGGLVAFDPAAAAACLAATAALGCGVELGSAPACDGLFVGQLPNGAACYDALECDAGTCTVVGIPPDAGPPGAFEWACGGFCDSTGTTVGFAQFCEVSQVTRACPGWPGYVVVADGGVCLPKSTYTASCNTDQDCGLGEACDQSGAGCVSSCVAAVSPASCDAGCVLTSNNHACDVCWCPDGCPAADEG